MKRLLSSFLLALSGSTGVAADMNYTYEECPVHADPQDCPVPDYTPCPEGQLKCGTKKARRFLAENEELHEQRKLQFEEKQFEIPNDSYKLPYDLPCFSPNRQTLKSQWTKWEQVDDGSVDVSLSFPFDFYGSQYNNVLVADNGFLSFMATFQNNYQPTSFPSGLGVGMIAPFWADVETAHNGNRGDIYYRDFGEVFAVIWDEVGYYKDGNVSSPTHNSFQVVISKSTNQRLPDLANICFCYLDMGWTHGDRDGVGGFGVFADATSGIRAATVGITKGLDDPFGTTTYAQIGRFNETGNIHRGVAVNSGVDWLDFLGSNGPQADARTGFCFNANPNRPPIFKAGPRNGTLLVPCGGVLDEYKFYFGTPEIEQTLSLVNQILPVPLPTGFSISYDGGGYASDTLGIRFEWLDIDFAAYGGQTFSFTFEVCDDHPQNPLCLTETVTLEVAVCGSGSDCFPDKCTPVTDSTCAAEPKPICTPWRSPEHCDPMFSFPTLVSSRWQTIKESLYGPDDILGNAGWWYHYTDDRAGAYAFTTTENKAAPPLYCCVTSVNALLGPTGNPGASTCFDGTPAWDGAYVIRAEGHHSSQGVFVLPTGLDTGGAATTELIGGNPVTIEQVRGYLNNLVPAPKKFVVEKFIAGSGAGATATLPDEYKFHMFNGQIGSISGFFGRGTDCACYGEYSEDWECLHKHGCFVPQMPLGVLSPEDPSCYDINFNAGSLNPFPVKGFDLCGPVTRPPACLFDKMKEIAVMLSEKLGVYARIDMFVGDNNEIYVQEYSFNHLGGTRHCAAVENESGCIDSCILGKRWQDAASAPSGDPSQGGPLIGYPEEFPANWGSLSDEEQCAAALALPAHAAGSSCP